MPLPKPLRVLLIEDDKADAELTIMAVQRAGYEVAYERVETAEAMAAALQRQAWDIVISDYSLPRFDGLAALRLFKESGLDIPFIVVSGAIGEEVAVAAMKAGAHDYVMKSHVSLLGPSVDRELRDAEVRHAHRHAQSELDNASQRLSYLVASNPAVLYSRAAGGNWPTTFISSNVKDQFGYEVRQFLDDPKFWATRVHPEDKETVFKGLARLFEIGRHTHEYRFRFADGRYRWVRDELRLIRDAAGKPKECVGTFMDITERKQAEEQVRRNAARAESLARTAGRLNAQLNPDAVLAAVCQEAARALDVPAASVLLYDTADDDLWIAETFGLPPEYRHRSQAIPRALYDRLAQKQGTVMVLPDVQAEPNLPNGLLYPEHGIRTIAAASMSREGQLIGSLNVYALKECRAFSPDDLALLKGLADQAAQAIINARLFREVTRRLAHVQALREIDTAITGSLDLRVTLNVFLEQVTTQLSVHAADVLLLNPHTMALEYAAGRGFRTAALRHTHLRLGEGHAGVAALERRMVNVLNLAEDADGFQRAPLLPNEEFIAYYAAPLVAKGHVRGVLEVFHRAPLDPEQDWLDFLQTLAGQAAIAIDNASLFDDLQRSNLDLKLAYDTTLEGWSRALDLRDQETEGHTQRVAELTVRLAKTIGLSETDIVHVRRGALLHDIGKMGIPDKVLLKPGKLDDEEWKVMKRHPTYALELLSPIAYLRPALDIPYCHHEKWDGSGYPRGLKGEQIPLSARIFAAVDVWDAMRSDRPYRKAMPEDAVREHIGKGSGTHFDPKVVEAFLAMQF